MNRHRLLEIADRPWFPLAFRDLITDMLQFGIVRFRIYDVVIPLIQEVLQHTKMTQILDLSSGGSGPWVQLQAQLRDRMKHPSVILTDKYPNLKAFKKANMCSGSNLRYWPEPVDATNVPAYLHGMRTIFSAFHHFEPAAATKILRDTVDQRSAICIFEFTERRLDGLFLSLLTFPFTLAAAPFQKPISLKTLFWVYVIPLIPCAFTYDAVVSYLKTYSPKDLRELVRNIHAPEYVWKIGQVASGVHSINITYLLGFPGDPATTSE